MKKGYLLIRTFRAFCIPLNSVDGACAVSTYDVPLLQFVARERGRRSGALR